MRIGVAAAACVILVSSAPRALAQGVRTPEFERPNRYEGLVGLPISGSNRPALDLISFTGSFEPFAGDADLQVTFFLPPSRTEAQVVAQELTQDKFYRMESKAREWKANSWSVFGPWPAREVIVPGGVRPANIGVVVLLDDAPEGKAVVAPAFVHQGKTVAGPLTGYRVQLRPLRATLSAVDYTLDRVEPDRLTPVDKRRLAVERPERRPFPIDLDATTLPDGRYLLTVVGHVKNSSTLKITRQYEFEHRRLPK